MSKPQTTRSALKNGPGDTKHTILYLLLWASPKVLMKKLMKTRAKAIV